MGDSALSVSTTGLTLVRDCWPALRLGKMVLPPPTTALVLVESAWRESAEVSESERSSCPRQRQRVGFRLT